MVLVVRAAKWGILLSSMVLTRSVLAVSPDCGTLTDDIYPVYSTDTRISDLYVETGL